MFSKQAQFFGAGGQGMPTAEPGFGQRMRLIGSSIAANKKGTVLQLGSSRTDPLLAEGTSVGDGTPALTVELPNNASIFEVGSINFIYNSDDALTEDGEGLFVPAGFQVQARILVPANTGLLAGSPLMVDYATTPGILIPAVNTAGNVQKVVAYVSQDIPDVGVSAAEETHWVYFTG